MKEFEIENNVLIKYHEKDGITDVVIPKGVIEIGYCAFYCCASLTNVTISKGVTKIGACAFADCRSLTSITIPEGVTKIGTWAFNKCTSLIEITIPEGVTKIGTWAFNKCTSLIEITIPEGVTTIGASAFSVCDNIKTFNIPSYNIFNMLDDDSKAIALNTIIRDKKQGEYTEEDISKFKEYIINNKMDIFESILKNSNLINLFYYILDNNIKYTKEELKSLRDDITRNDSIDPEIKTRFLKYNDINKKSKDIESIIDDEYNLDDDIGGKENAR